MAGHQGWVRSVAFCPDGKTLASAGLDGTVRLWRVATGKEIRRFRGHQSGVHSVAFSADGSVLVSGSADSTLLSWDVTGFRDE
jgi:WD40 repeat protein